ncbi:uncharacterized protein FA14DRAFT_161577 [Meira miltonrushii]|uniref:Uncharacterized protein n=1 Tax=Meira miltonrushii TaxID=1280837 RepID=A0A316V8R1_9BASI|nr:uncharacterized protein FA14DRAFT_161577 [Meira miltonrushii]PWN33989.1 hypothetical protein FA14DRAFT_161577 [Meira miltonrushii]
MWKQSVRLVVYAIAVLYAVSIMATASSLRMKKEARTFLRRDEPSQDCGSPQTNYRCLFVCPMDSSCQQLGFNRSELSCGCHCQLCPDHKYYGPVQNYKNSKPLTDDQRKGCPDVVYPCDNNDQSGDDITLNIGSESG